MAKNSSQRADRSGSRDRSPSSEASPGWTPALSALALVVFAFFSGLFVGQELLHKPQVVAAAAQPAAAGLPGESAAPAAAPAANTDTSAAGTSGAGAPTGHDDASMREAIAHTDDSQRLLLLSKLFMEEQRNDLAAMAARKAVQLDPGSASAHALLALSLETSAQNIPEVRRELRKALSLNPPAAVKAAIQKELTRLGPA